MLPEVIGSLYEQKGFFLEKIKLTAGRINGRNASLYWETERSVDYVYTFLKRKKEIDMVEDEELNYWINFFEKDKKEAGLQFWYEIHKGIHESLREFE